MHQEKTRSSSACHVRPLALERLMIFEIFDYGLRFSNFANLNSAFLKFSNSAILGFHRRLDDSLVGPMQCPAGILLTCWSDCLLASVINNNTISGSTITACML